MRKLLLAGAAWLGLTVAAHAQVTSAVVVSGCGTPPVSYVVGQAYPLTMDTTGKLCGLNTGGGGSSSVTQGTVPWVDAGLDAGPQVATATPANSSHAAGTSIGGLFTVAVARVVGGSGIVANFFYKSTGGATTVLVARVWEKSPASTTCTDNTAFAGADADDAYLITPPFAITPAAPANTTGDSATYAAVTQLSWDYANADTSSSVNLYVCIVTATTDTADENKLVRVSLSGPRN